MTLVPASRGWVRRRSARDILWAAGIALTPLWIVLGLLIWSGTTKRFPPLSVLALPAGLTTWPAHESWLVLRGYGMGYNRLFAIDALSVLVMTVWCLLLWSPTLSMRFHKAPWPVPLVLQGALLALVLALFPVYGNG